MNLNDLETFICVAEAGTFSGAAALLGVPKSTVSRRVARLEEALGLALLVRSARSFVLSDDGRALYERCAPALREIADVERGLGDTAGAPRGRLSVTASIDLSNTPFLSGLLAGYLERYGQVQVSLEVSNRSVDLMEEGFDLAFRTHTGPLPDRDDLVARRLGRVTIGVYTSPAYLAAHGPIGDWRRVGELRTVCHARAHGATWPTSPSLTVDDYGPAAAILAAGGGVGGLPDFVAAPLVQRGALVRLPLRWEVPEATLSLVWLRSRQLAPRVRAFIDLAVEHAGAAEWLG